MRKCSLTCGVQAIFSLFVAVHRGPTILPVSPSWALGLLSLLLPFIPAGLAVANPSAIFKQPQRCSDFSVISELTHLTPNASGRSRAQSPDAEHAGLPPHAACTLSALRLSSYLTKRLMWAGDQVLVTPWPTQPHSTLPAETGISGLKHALCSHLGCVPKETALSRLSSYSPPDLRSFVCIKYEHPRTPTLRLITSHRRLAETRPNPLLNFGPGRCRKQTQNVSQDVGGSGKSIADHRHPETPRSPQQPQGLTGNGRTMRKLVEN